MEQTCLHTVALTCNNIKLVVYRCYLPLLGDGIRQSHDVSQLCVPMSFGGRSFGIRAISAFLGNTRTTLLTYDRRNWIVDFSPQQLLTTGKFSL